ncbi:hypothetical protein SAMN04487983_106510 [Streptomyces sp. yr375]|uniref:hypothetical protein n=1 Tax=Streptomyces sp. yr375 TaxID=1761906 RepID=UPI0008C8A337|nr:hypothetical protein [Streptomyces sp. yr375]SES47716.1 hypothetical protein SAMN04487983_106510 [Streptomyces sp. yr375]
MRPLDYRDYLVDLLKNTPDVQRVDIIEGGPHPYALAVTAAGSEQRWQIIGQLAEGAKHDTPTAAVHGQPAEWTTAPANGPADAWLAAVIGAADSPDTRLLEVWSTREEKTSEGVTVFFHNGERAFLRKF